MSQPTTPAVSRYSSWLRGEVDAWVRDGLISPEQAERIKARYPVAPEHRDYSRLIAILSTLGVLLVGAGVILFFAANWQGIPKWGKLTLILGAIMATHGLGYYLRYHSASRPRTGEALILLGTVFFGAAIWLIAQIFHINAHYPDGLFYWALGALPAAWAAASAPVLCFAALLFTFWNVIESVGFFNASPLYVGIMAAVVVPMCYWLRSAPALVLTLIGLNYWIGAYMVFAPEPVFAASLVFLYPATGALMYGAGLLHRAHEGAKHMDRAYCVPGMIATLMSVYLLTFSGVLSEVPKEWAKAGAGGSMLVFWVLYGAAAVAVGLAAWRSRADAGARPRYEIGCLAAILVLSFVVLLTLAAKASDSETVHVLVLVMNLAFFLLALGLIYGGYRGRRLDAVNLGTLFFVLGVVSRYFDSFWALMPRSAFFMAGGLLLLLLGTFMERKRRQMVREIAGGQP